MNDSVTGMSDRPIAPSVDQDMMVVASMQQGVRSRGFDGVYLCRQERRIQFLHENIDRYLGVDSGCMVSRGGESR